MSRSVFWSAYFNGRSDNTDVIPLNQKWCQHLNKNPYESPAEVDDNESARNPSSDAPSTEEAAENLRFTSQIVRGLSIFCGLAAAHSLLSLVMGYYYLGFSDGWNWFHTLTTVRGLAIPAFAILCRFSWCYASSLRDFANSFPSTCLLYTSPSPRDRTRSRMPSSA